MPSALRASKDFLARAIARVRSGVEQGDRYTREPGPDIKVEPFDSHNVSTAAGLIKLGTSIGAEHRRRANFAEAQKGVALEREKNREQIALIRAQTKYALGEGRQTGRGAATLTSDVGPYKAGTPLTDVNAGMAERRLNQSAESAKDRNRTIGRVSAAQAGLKQIDERMAQDTQREATLALGTWATTFDAAARGNPVALKRLGISPEDFMGPENYPTTGPQRVSMLEQARKRIGEKLVNVSRLKVAPKYLPERKKYQSIIDQGAQGFDDGADTGDGSDPNDPLGILGDDLGGE